MTEQQIYVEFTVQVRDGEYTYGGPSGRASVDAQIPLAFVPMLDMGNVFEGLLQTALDKFDAEPADEEKDTGAA